jgi:hypothetical protein
VRKAPVTDMPRPRGDARCPIGFVSCRSDYRLGVPAGVAVTIDKSSGRVDAQAVGGGITELRDDAAPLTVTAR